MDIRRLTQKELEDMPRVELGPGVLSFDPLDNRNVSYPEPRTMSFEYELDPRVHRQLVEVLYGMCIHCWQVLRLCSCHERGYN